MSSLFNKASVTTAIAHAYGFQRRHCYVAAKHLLAPFLAKHPQHEGLQKLSQHIEQQQQRALEKQQAALKKPR